MRCCAPSVVWLICLWDVLVCVCVCMFILNNTAKNQQYMLIYICLYTCVYTWPRGASKWQLYQKAPPISQNWFICNNISRSDKAPRGDWSSPADPRIENIFIDIGERFETAQYATNNNKHYISSASAVNYNYKLVVDMVLCIVSAANEVFCTKRILIFKNKLFNEILVGSVFKTQYSLGLDRWSHWVRDQYSNKKLQL